MLLHIHAALWWLLHFAAATAAPIVLTFTPAFLQSTAGLINSILHLKVSNSHQRHNTQQAQPQLEHAHRPWTIQLAVLPHAQQNEYSQALYSHTLNNKTVLSQT